MGLEVKLIGLGWEQKEEAVVNLNLNIYIIYYTLYLLYLYENTLNEFQ